MWQPKTDSWIAHDLLIEPIKRACSIPFLHPNVITVTALILSIAIVPLHNYKHYGLVVLCALCRQLADCVDGEVARTCNKSSRIGGFLDTTADFVFLAATGYVSATFFTSSVTLQIANAFLNPLIVMIWYYMVDGQRAFYDHAAGKDYERHPLLALIMENSFVIVVITCCVYIGAIMRHRP